MAGERQGLAERRRSAGRRDGTSRQQPDRRAGVYGDSAYGSGQAAPPRDGGHDTVIKPGPLRPAVPGGFTLDDFAIDEEHGTVTCPAGITRR